MHIETESRKCCLAVMCNASRASRYWYLRTIQHKNRLCGQSKNIVWMQCEASYREIFKSESYSFTQTLSPVSVMTFHPWTHFDQVSIKHCIIYRHVQAGETKCSPIRFSYHETLHLHHVLQKMQDLIPTLDMTKLWICRIACE